MRLRAAVIGAGLMGANHIRLLKTMPDVELVAVVDANRARALARVTGTEIVALTAIDELPDIDLAVIATPTTTHAELAEKLIGKGVHLLVEKPLAVSAEEADRMVAAARGAGVTLAVGHVERFNAAFGLLASLVRDPRMLSFERLSPFTPRIGDSVVMDLMVHDLDLALWILGEYPSRIEAVGASVFSEDIDLASASLQFSGGRIATFQASRATQDKVRRITISEPERFIVADSIRQDVSIKRETTVAFSEEEGSHAYRQANVVEVPYLNRSGEPLARELRDFVDAVREGRSPAASGADGAAAVRLAEQVEAAIGVSR